MAELVLVRSMLARVVVVLSAGTLLTCSKEPPAFSTRERSRVESPSGWCVASIVEFGGRDRSGSKTQVLLTFDGGNCSASAVSFEGAGVPLELHWIDAATLEVRYPKGSKFTRNGSGELLQCSDRKVHVILLAV